MYNTVCISILQIYLCIELCTYKFMCKYINDCILGTLVCQLLQLTSEAGVSLCLEMATTRAAKALGVEHYIGVGMPADIVLMTIEGPTLPPTIEPASFCEPW
jgi:hypothetical protein